MHWHVDAVEPRLVLERVVLKGFPAAVRRKLEQESQRHVVDAFAGHAQHDLLVAALGVQEHPVDELGGNRKKRASREEQGLDRHMPERVLRREAHREAQEVTLARAELQLAQEG